MNWQQFSNWNSTLASCVCLSQWIGLAQASSIVLCDTDVLSERNKRINTKVYFGWKPNQHQKRTLIGLFMWNRRSQVMNVRIPLHLSDLVLNRQMHRIDAQNQLIGILVFSKIHASLKCRSLLFLDENDVIFDLTAVVLTLQLSRQGRPKLFWPSFGGVSLTKTP